MAEKCRMFETIKELSALLQKEKDLRATEQLRAVQRETSLCAEMEQMRERIINENSVKYEALERKRDSLVKEMEDLRNIVNCRTEKAELRQDLEKEIGQLKMQLHKENDMHVKRQQHDSELIEALRKQLCDFKKQVWSERSKCADTFVSKLQALEKENMRLKRMVEELQISSKDDTLTSQDLSEKIEAKNIEEVTEMQHEDDTQEPDSLVKKENEASGQEELTASEEDKNFWSKDSECVDTARSKVKKMISYYEKGARSKTTPKSNSGEENIDTLQVENIVALQVGKVGALHDENVGKLQGENVDDLHLENVGTLQVKNIDNPQGENVSDLHDEKVGSLHDENVGTLHKENVGKLQGENVGDLHLENVGALQVKNIDNPQGENIGDFPDEKVSDLHDEKVGALQFEKIDDLQVENIDSSQGEKLDDLHNENIGALQFEKIDDLQGKKCMDTVGSTVKEMISYYEKGARSNSTPNSGEDNFDNIDDLQDEAPGGQKMPKKGKVSKNFARYVKAWQWGKKTKYTFPKTT